MKTFDGDIDDYRRLVLEGPRASAPRRSAPSSNGTAQERRKAAADARAQTAPLRKKIKETESLMEKLRREIEAADGRLADPALYAKDPSKATAEAKARAETVRALAAAEEEWLTLSAELEAADGEA